MEARLWDAFDDALVLTSEITSTSLEDLKSMDIEEFLEDYRAVRRRKSEKGIQMLNTASLPYVSDKREQKQLVDSMVDLYVTEEEREQKRERDKRSLTSAF